MERIVHRWRRGVLIGVAVGSIAVGTGGAATNVTTAGGLPPGTANVWMDTNGGTCTRSSTPVAYHDAAACGNLNATYHAMHCGDVAIIKNGDFRTVTSGPTGEGVHDMEVQAHPAANSCTGNRLTIKGETQQGVVFRHVYYGNDATGSATAGPHNLILKNVRMTGGWEANGDDVNDTLNHIDGGSFAVCCTAHANMLIENSDWGPCDPNGDPINGQEADCLGAWTDSSAQSQNRICCGMDGLTIQHNVFHQMWLSPGNPAHYECIFNAGGFNVTMRENIFAQCGTNGWAGGADGVNKPSTQGGTWVIENNWCLSNGGDATAQNGAQACFKLSNLPWDATVYFLFNSSNQGYGIWNEEWNQGGEARGDWPYAHHVIEIGNLQGNANTNGAWCLWDANNKVIPQIMGYNIYSGSGTGCAGVPATHGTVLSNRAYDAMFISPDHHYGTGNLCLRGSPGSTPADNYVPQSTLAGVPYDYVDINGNPRPHSGKLDAGACERPAACVVPNLVGRRSGAAKRAIKGHNCSVGKIKHAFSTRIKKGHVISQKPKSHKRLNHGAKVNFVVSNGKKV